MDTTSAPHPSRAYDADIAAATAHLKESWEYGKEAARDARRIAKKKLDDLSGGIDAYVEARPATIALWALGAGLVAGVLLTLLARRAFHRHA
jgi:ElaB/YqjD/DUF883 family membrane-anchored ribosome-binding protein